MGAFSSTAHAQTADACDISDFINPDKSIDTTGYLACVQFHSDTTPQPSPDCPTADLQLAATADPNILEINQVTQFTAVGFAPDSDVNVVLCSTPVALGTFKADANGEVHQALTIPAGTVLGAHTIAATGNRSNGLQQVAYAAITVVAAPTTGTLPTTGSDTGRMIAIGAALLVLGGAAIFGSTRVRRPVTIDAD